MSLLDQFMPADEEPADSRHVVHVGEVIRLSCTDVTYDKGDHSMNNTTVYSVDLGVRVGNASLLLHQALVSIDLSRSSVVRRYTASAPLEVLRLFDLHTMCDCAERSADGRSESVTLRWYSLHVVHKADQPQRPSLSGQGRISLIVYVLRQNSEADVFCHGMDYVVRTIQEHTSRAARTPGLDAGTVISGWAATDVVKFINKYKHRNIMYSLLPNLDRVIVVRLCMTLAWLTRGRAYSDGSPKFASGVYHWLYHYTPLRGLFRYTCQVTYCVMQGVILSNKMSPLILPAFVADGGSHDPAQDALDRLSGVLGYVDELTVYHVYALTLPMYRLRQRFEEGLRLYVPKRLDLDWGVYWPMYELAIIQAVQDTQKEVSNKLKLTGFRTNCRAAGTLSNVHC